jgi:hypothetical protein
MVICLSIYNKFKIKYYYDWLKTLNNPTSNVFGLFFWDWNDVYHGDILDIRTCKAGHV